MDATPSVRSGADGGGSALSLTAAPPSCTSAAASATAVRRRAPIVAAMRHRTRPLIVFLLRVDVCWSIVYFILLASVAILVTTITQNSVLRALRDSWHAVHNAQVTTVTELISLMASRAHDLANGFMAVNMPRATSNGGPGARAPSLSTLCAALDHYDTQKRFRGLLTVSVDRSDIVACVHGLRRYDEAGQMVSFVSHQHIVDGAFLVDAHTYALLDPPQMILRWPPDIRNMSVVLPGLYRDTPVVRLVPAYLNGTVASVDPRLHWVASTAMPHILSYILPLGYLARGLPLLPSKFVSVTDFTQVRIDGSRLLDVMDDMTAADVSVAAFISQSLADADPFIMSNNWGQPSVSDDEVFTSAFPDNITYLRVSDISDPLMRAALKHVDLARLQELDHYRSADFIYKGAPATVSAYTFTAARGLTVPLVFVSSQAAVTLPFVHIMTACSVVLAATVVLLSVLFWVFVQLYFAQPLREITRLLDRSVQRGARALYRAGRHGIGALAEVRALGRAHNAAMRQLREVDAFVPAAVRDQLYRRRQPPPDSAAHTPAATTATAIAAATGPPTPGTTRAQQQQQQQPGQDSPAARMARHLSTAVYVTLRPPRSTGAPRGPHAPHHGQRLAVAVERAAQTVGAANSGPFATPAALGAFAAAVHELAATHRGTVLRLCPDACVLHFHAAVRAHLPPAAPQQQQQDATATDAQQQQEEELHSQQDARDAAAFALALLAWVDAQRQQQEQQQASPGGADGGGAGAAAATAADVPDVRALLDTGLFTCGQYRPAGSEQTMTVALGRDAQRDAGRVAERIGVRVALTGETAARVCAVVRALPVEALRTGRAGRGGSGDGSGDGDLLLLYEALPGRAAGDAAWPLYARCCADGFARMRRGDYAGALSAYRGAADVPDLEPGLLPPGMRREAAPSSARGGAVSTQLARLMRECQCRLHADDTAPFQRTQRPPPGIDAVLRHLSEERAAKVARGNQHTSDALQGTVGADYRGQACCGRDRSDYAVPRNRAVTLVVDGEVEHRCVFGCAPRWLRDCTGVVWSLPNGLASPGAAGPWNRPFIALGSAGTLGCIFFLPYRDVHPVVAKAIRDAPPGPMSDALRSAAPVTEASSQERAALAQMFALRRALVHPNIIRFLSHSHAVEGGIAIVFALCSAGTMREALRHYHLLCPVTLLRWALDALSALCFLHAHQVVHGAVSLDNIMVGADGVCRVKGFYADYALVKRMFRLSVTYYVSPAMAAGVPPTPACDMFCYGLLLLEAMTRQPCWRWATPEEYAGHAAPHAPPSAKALADLMAGGGRAFSNAVAQGRVVAHVELLGTAAAVERHEAELRDAVCRLLSPDAAARPTAEEMREIVMASLTRGGLVVAETE